MTTLLDLFLQENVDLAPGIDEELDPLAAALGDGLEADFGTDEDPLGQEGVDPFFGMPARRGNQDPLGGRQYSGKATCTRAGERRNVVRGGVEKNNGLCSVSVSVTRISHGDLEGCNQRLVLYVRWQTGSGGDDSVEVDATTGGCFTIGGAEIVEIDAQIVTAVLGEALVATDDMRVEITLHWGTSLNPKPARCVLPGQRLTAIAAGAAQEIPKQARDFIALVTDPTVLPTLTIVQSRFPAVGTPAELSRTLNPNANGTPIVAGAKYLMIQAPAAACLVTIVFDMFL